MKYVISILLIIVAVWLTTKNRSQDTNDNSPKNSVINGQSEAQSAVEKVTVSAKSKNLLNHKAESDVNQEKVTQAVQSAKTMMATVHKFADYFEGELPSWDTWKELQRLSEGTLEESEPRGTSEWFLKQLQHFKNLTNDEGSLSDREQQTTLTLEDIFAQDEIRFSYTKNVLRTDDGKTPVLMMPMVSGSLEFDPFALEGKAVVVYLNNLVQVYDVNADGTLAAEGAVIFDHGENNPWGERPLQKKRIAFPSKK